MTVKWARYAACGSDPEDLFQPGAHQRIAKKVCRACPVREECLVEALDNRIDFGVWGGLTERERRALLRRYPSISSWRIVVRNVAGNFANTAAPDVRGADDRQPDRVQTRARET